MVHLTTERLTLRNFISSDWKALHTLINQFAVVEMAAYDQPWPMGENAIKGVTEWFASGDDYLAVCLKPTGEFIGFVTLNLETDEGQRTFNLGDNFNSIYQGKGYARKPARLCFNVLS
jgi:RimJ/RimL family protein N-acetyltransferase